MKSRRKQRKNVVPEISRQTQKRIHTALDRAADLVCEEGLHPDQALAKAAAEVKLNRDQVVNVLVPAFNVAHSETHRKMASSVLEAASPFPIADPDRVAALLWPEKVAGHKEWYRSRAVDPVYYTPPDWYTEKLRRKRMDRVGELRKQANADAAERGAPAPRYNHDWDYESRRRRYHDLLHEGRELEIKAASAAAAVKSALVDLARYFQRLGSIPFEEFSKRAEMVYGEPGKRIAAYLERTHDFRGLKQARTLTPFNPNDEPYRLLRDALDAFQKKAIADRELRRYQESFTRRRVNLFGPYAEEVGLVREDPILGIKVAGIGGLFATGVGMGFGRELVKKVPGTESTSELERKIYNKIYNPEHNQRLRIAKTKLILTDLISNDPVISEAPPEEVAQIYNELVSIAPSLASEPVAVRALIRRRLQQGAFDPYEIENIAKTEATLSRTRNPSRSIGMGVGVLPDAPGR